MSERAEAESTSTDAVERERSDPVLAPTGPGFGAAPTTARRVLALQRTVGNRAVGRMIAGQARALQRQEKPAWDPSETRPSLELEYRPGETEHALFDLDLGGPTMSTSTGKVDRPIRDPTVEEARYALYATLLKRRATDLAARLLTATVVPYVSKEDGAWREEFRDMYGTPIARVRRFWSFFLLSEYVEVKWLSQSVGPEVATGQLTGPAGAPKGPPDPFANLYRTHFPPTGGETVVSQTDAMMRIRLALDLADETFLGEFAEAFKNAIHDPVFIGVTVASIALYVGLWLAPDVTVTKVIAGALTAIMLLMFTWQDLWGFCKEFMDLSSAVQVATGEADLKVAGDKFLTKLGQVGFDIFLMLLFWGIEKGVGPKVKASVRARATARVNAAALEASHAIGTGERVAPAAGRARLVDDAKTSARARASAPGDGVGPPAPGEATPGQILDALADALPNDRARRGLTEFRAKSGDANAMKAVEGQQRANNDIVRWLEEQAMSKEEKAAVKSTAARAKADAALARILELGHDPALSENVKRAGWVQNLIALFDAMVDQLGQLTKKAQDAIKASDIEKLVGILGEVLARAELRRRISGLSGFELRSDLEVARRVPGYKTVGEWQNATFSEQIRAWEEGGRQGPRPGAREAARMRTRGNEVWESLGQADNMVVEKKGNGQYRIDTIEETKTGSESADSAKAQATSFRDTVASINDGARTGDVRVFEKTGPTELGADRTGDFDLTTARDAAIKTRGLKGRTGFDTELPADRPTLEAAAKALIERGPTADPAGPPPMPGPERKDDKKQ